MKRSFAGPLPVDLRLTLRPLQRGRLDPSLRLFDHEAIRATRTPDGPATIHMATDGERVDCEAWGPGSTWALEKAPALLGNDDRIDDFRPEHPYIAELHRGRPGLRMGRSQNVIEFLVPTILEQKVTGKEARRSYMKLVARFGEPAPGPVELRVPPGPTTIRDIPSWEWHVMGVERRREEAIKRVCERAARLERIVDLDPIQAHLKLTSIPGIGNWTASHTTMITMGNSDAVLVGDYHIPHLVGWVLAREPRGSDERMLELLEPFKGHRARVIRLIETGSDRPERRAPRRALRSIARI